MTTTKQERRRAYWRKQQERLRLDPAYREKQKRYMHQYVRTEEYKARRAARKAANWKHHLFIAWRSNAKRRGIAFSLSEADVPWREVCPVLGCRIQPALGGSKPADDSVSLDRIDNAKGYERGNVIVVSYRANRIKNDASLDELERLVRVYRGLR